MGRERDGWWGYMGSLRKVIPSIRTLTAVLCLQHVTEADSIRISRDSHLQQPGTTHILPY